MMKDIKSCFKLLKYGYQVKSNMLAALIFLLLGIAFAFTNYENFPLVVMYIFLAISFVYQGVYTILFSSFVAASPARKKIELRYIDILNVIGGLLGVAITLVLAFCLEPEELSYTSFEVLLILGGFIIIVMYVYMSTAFKKMVIGTILFFAGFMGVMMGTGFLSRLLVPVMEGKRVLAVIIFLLEFVLGVVLASVVRRALYRKDMSKWVMGAKVQMEQS